MCRRLHCARINLRGAAWFLCQRPQRLEQGRGFDQAGGQPALQGVQRRGHVLVLEHGGEHCTEHLQTHKQNRSNSISYVG